MHVLSRLTIRQVLAVALFITLTAFGSASLQAQKKSHDQGCGCREKPAPQSCPQTLREKPTAPPPVACCPVDPKDVSKAQKDAEHAQHEAAEACKRQQRAAAKAQKKIDQAYENGNHEVDEANAKLEKRRGEYSEATAKLESLQSSNEAVASNTTTTEESEIMRSKPEPVAPAAPAPSIETPSTSEAAPAPAPAPEATQAMSQPPKELPKTASPLELLGLIGLASSISGYVTRRFRG